MGSVISNRHLQRIEEMIQRRGRGNILAGGRRLVGKSVLDGFDFSQGSFFPPTVISDIVIEDELWQEEIFGPVVVVKTFTVGTSYSRQLVNTHTDHAPRVTGMLGRPRRRCIGKCMQVWPWGRNMDF